MFSEFDEFSFWGTAAQMTKTTDRLYTVGEYGTPWLPSQNPGLIMLGYFVQFFGQFAHFKVYLGYDLLLFACIAALVGVTELCNYRLSIPLATIGWLTPWFLTTYNRTIMVSKVYMSAYGDIPAGMLIGGTVALWIALRRVNGPVWTILPVLAFLANIKDNTFPLALITAALVAADYFLFGHNQKWRTGWVKRLGFSALSMAAPLTLYRAWGAYIAKLVIANSEAGGMGATSEDTVSVAINGTRLLMGLSVPEYYQVRAERFFDVAHRMREEFYSPEKPLSAIGQGVIVTVLILFIFLTAILFAANARDRLRAGLWCLGSTTGFVAYNYVLALCYGFIFKEFQAARLEDYNRYMTTYYIGWFIMAVAMLSWVVQTGRARRIVNTGLLGFACLMLLRVNMLVLPQFSVLGFSDATFADQHIMQQKAEAVKNAVGDDSRVFIVTQGDNGLRWFTYGCYLQPNVLDYSGWEQDPETGRWGAGGGTFGLPENAPDPDESGAIYYHAYTAEELDKVIRESGSGYIFVEKLDAGFVEAYGNLFKDDLSAALSGETLLYKVEEGLFVPVSMEVPA
ncbi:hypothetical protein, membrane [gut metagenome]|uniref:Uncharacterized protein n=1 Tax=gut metagenome TaxID=749906 RepID=J9D7P9_9ZZZZ